MKKLYKVTGMMCDHCENHVKEYVEKLEGVKSAKANHKKELLKVVSKEEIPVEQIKSAVEDAGYKFEGEI